VAVTGTGFSVTSSPPANTTVAAGSGVVHVGVKFDAATKGSASGTLVATFDGGQQRSVQLTARALGTSMAVTPDGDVNFGPVCVGSTKPQPFTILANDEGAFSLTGVTGVTGDLGAAFRVSATTPATLPARVLGSGANQIGVEITAAPAAVGPATAAVSLVTDIPAAAPHVVNLAVQGLPAGVTATPESIDLGAVALDTATIGQPVTLSNCAAGPITASNARIEGPDAAEFAIVNQPASPAIALGGNASWLIVLQAHSAGVKQAAFAVDYDGGTASIPLTGEGLAGPSGPGDPGGPGDDAPGSGAGRASYYACSTGRPLALWPVVAAVALVALRRRRGPAR
jgi:hypothetical protein